MIGADIHVCREIHVDLRGSRVFNGRGLTVDGRLCRIAEVFAEYGDLRSGHHRPWIEVRSVHDAPHSYARQRSFILTGLCDCDVQATNADRGGAARTWVRHYVERV